MGSILKVDDLRGNTAAGNITITGEGGSATMQLQQGLLKTWCLWEQDSTQAVSDSFNVASITDLGTGYTRHSLTNNFSTANYSAVLNAIHDAGTYANTGYISHDDPPTTSTLRADYLTTASAAFDTELCSVHMAGDLA